MRTDVECLACFLQQTVSTAQVSTSDTLVQREVVNVVGRLLSQLDTALSPPENAVTVYKKIAEVTGVHDPYFSLKEKGSKFAAGLRDQVRSRINCSENPLYSAVRYAIAANIIDYGSQHSFDAMSSMENCLAGDLVIDDFVFLLDAITKAGQPDVLYLADNCGEIVFDGLLIEQLQNLGCNVTLAVRGDVILNDATLDDALASGLDSLCRIITSGIGCPGTPVECCSDELQQTFGTADIIISKGQGNFETLSGISAPLFFLLTVKCQVVARHIVEKKGLETDMISGQGEMILMQGGWK